MSIDTNWQGDLLNLLGTKKVLLDQEALARHASDKWYASHMPDVVVMPSTTQDVAAMMQFASERNIPVTPRGGGVGYVGGSVPVKGGILLSFEQMNRILEISPQDGVAVVQPGVITADLQEQVAAQGWFYPPDPASRKECTIGGNIATNAGGPRCLKYGVTRPYVLGLEVVLSSGEIVRCGGRTHKNKVGFDLVGLFTGSEGMLGIVTEATLRIIPHPESRCALSVSFEEFSQAADGVGIILNNGHLPAALEITDAFTLNAARNYLGPSSLPENSRAHLIVEIDGRADGLSQELLEIEELLLRNGAIEIRKATTEEEVESIWQLRREFSYSLKATGMKKLNEDIVIPRSQLVNLVQFCENLQQGQPFSIACFGHAGDGNIHTNVMVSDYDDAKQKAAADHCVDTIFQWVLAHGGSITGEHGIGLAKAKWFPDSIGPHAYELHKTLKRALDPQNILNPGKMGLP